MKRYITYMILFGDGYLYTGCTGSPRRRNRAHFEKDKNYKVVWKESFSSREEALEREAQIKGWTRAKKMALVGLELSELQKLSNRRASKPKHS